MRLSRRVATLVCGGRSAARRALCLSLAAACCPSAHLLAQPTGAASSIVCAPCAPADARRLLGDAAIRAVLHLGYEPAAGVDAPSRMAAEPALEDRRAFTRALPDGALRTLEIAHSRHPAAGRVLHLLGEELRDGVRSPNLDVADLDAHLQGLVAGVGSTAAAPALRDLGYYTYRLSHAQSDRVMGLLKGLGYSTIEYQSSPADIGAWEDVFDPILAGERKLPVVVKLLDSDKTSLLEPEPGTPSPMAPQMPQPQQYGAFVAKAAVPDIGGEFLHSTTAGEPLQRLLLVYDPADPQPLEALLQLLREHVDVPAQQIVIEALVIEINTERLGDLGFTFGYGSGEVATTFERDATGRQLPFTFTYDKFFDFEAFRVTLNALVNDGDAEVLSNPSVLVLDGRQARIQIGQQIPIVTSTATVGVVSQSVEYFPVGIVLNLRPRIDAGGGEVTMQVETVVSAIAAAATQVGSGDNVVVAPTIDNRRVQTLVRVADNTPFIIGGLISSEERETLSRVPGLSRIPGLGWLFRRKVTERSKNEVIVVITPHVVPLGERNFSYVIPKEADRFDSLEHQLFRDSYRLRQREIFDLGFVRDSVVLRDLVARLRARAEVEPELLTTEPFAGLLAGRIPGEEILARRMLWETVRNTGAWRHVDLERIIAFERTADGADLQLRFLRDLLDGRAAAARNTLVLQFLAPADAGVAPRLREVRVDYADVAAAEFGQRLMAWNGLGAGAQPGASTLLLADSAPTVMPPLDLLRSVLVLDRLLDLNTSLPLRLDEIYVGRDVVYPSADELQSAFHVVDEETARLFFEVQHYYPAFEAEFNRVVQAVSERLH